MPFVFGAQDGAEALKEIQAELRLFSMTFLWRNLNKQDGRAGGGRKKKAQVDYSELNMKEISVLTVGGAKEAGARKMADKLKNMRREQQKSLSQRMYSDMFSEKGPSEEARKALGTLLDKTGVCGGVRAGEARGVRAVRRGWGGGGRHSA